MMSSLIQNKTHLNKIKGNKKHLGSASQQRGNTFSMQMNYLYISDSVEKYLKMNDKYRASERAVERHKGIRRKKLRKQEAFLFISRGNLAVCVCSCSLHLNVMSVCSVHAVTYRKVSDRFPTGSPAFFYP